MIYSPSHYKEIRPELAFEAIRQYSFATLITIDADQPFVSHLPLLLESNNKTLIGHCAKANPQWRHFVKNKQVTAIFHGPHAYISPAWYQPKADNVPTWNYVAVHIKGTVRILEKNAVAYEVMNKLVSHYEEIYGTKWTLPQEPNVELLDDLNRGIVVFEITIGDLVAKFKLSQKQDSIDRNSVIKNLPMVGGIDGQKVADYMTRVMHD